MIEAEPCSHVSPVQGEEKVSVLVAALPEGRDIVEQVSVVGTNEISGTRDQKVPESWEWVVHFFVVSAYCV